MKVPIGETSEVDTDPTALLVPSAEFTSPYTGLSDDEQARIMAEVEPPTLPVVKLLIEE